MKKIATIITLAALATSAFAQRYNTAFGVRLGTDWGITIQQRIAERTTLEAIVQAGFKRSEAMVTLLGEQHFPFLGRRFNTYIGAGPHIGWRTDDPGSPEFGADYKNPLGVTFIGGIELNLFRLNVSWDFKPAINLVGGVKSVYFQSGVSLRYIIFKFDKPNHRKGIKWKFWEKD